MMPQNSVDAFAFWIVAGIFVVLAGNLIYESLISHWLADRKLCPAPCCEKGDDDE